MHDFYKLLEDFLVEIENNPDKSTEDIIKDVALEKKLSMKGISDIEKSFGCIDDIYNKICELQNSSKSREEWFWEEIEKKISTIPHITEDQKERILFSIANSVLTALKQQ